MAASNVELQLWHACVHEAAHVVVMRTLGAVPQQVELAHAPEYDFPFHGEVGPAQQPESFEDAGWVPAVAVAGCIGETAVRAHEPREYLAQWAREYLMDPLDDLKYLLIMRSPEKGGDRGALAGHLSAALADGHPIDEKTLLKDSARQAAEILLERWEEVLEVATAIMEAEPWRESGWQVVIPASDLPSAVQG